MRRKIVAGNWKMNGSQNLVKQLVGDVAAQSGSFASGVDVVVIPPALYASQVMACAQGALKVGVQNVACWQSGAYTGEISAGMAQDIGCEYVLVGHSERRELFAESDEVTAEKVSRAIESGLTVIFCVGETLEQREADQATQVVSEQILNGLVTVSEDQWSQVVVAYEPVWAIGTGKTATAEDAQAMHSHIRSVLKAMNAPANEVSVLYGGSVKADNAAALFAEQDIDGGLIGGASLKADEFLSICRSFPAGT